MGPSASQLSRRRTSGTGFSLCGFAFALILLLASTANTRSQKPATEPAQSVAKSSTPAPTDKNAAQIELLETKYRFETNGDSRKEVHARVRINNELGARQFARLNFDFNRSFQSVEIPFVRVTHESGGTADILPSAITDNPNPAVVDFPAYHDVRVKSVRILGLAPGDQLEYRVITTTTHHPLAPDFWLDHTFDRSGVVSEELFEIDVPASRKVQMHVAAQYTYTIDESESSSDARVVYRWIEPKQKTSSAKPSTKESKLTDLASIPSASESDIVLTTFGGWVDLTLKLSLALQAQTDDPSIIAKALEVAKPHSTPRERLSAIYDFVSKNIRTVDLPLGSMGYRLRPLSEIFASNFATPEDKCALFSEMANLAGIRGIPALASKNDYSERALAVPSLFTHVLFVSRFENSSLWLDPTIEVAPFGAVSSALRGKPALMLSPRSDTQLFESVPDKLPYESTQRVFLSSSISDAGILTVRVQYSLRGENELLLRVAFHQTPKERWKEIAQMLALSDGFRGTITNVTASDPYETQKPFTVDYEISQPKFVDWSKKTLRIPAILPLPGLPDPPTAEQIKSSKAIELGTPLAIDLESTLELPAGATAQAPIGTTVNRDYATFTSKYSVEGNKLHATRSLRFLRSELPASRATDLNAFLRAVQSDQSQLFTVTPAPQK